jgi:cell division protein FtsW
MLIVKKGDQLRRLTKGVLPFFVVIGLLDVLAALEPDLSVAMLYTLLLAVLLFAGGVRIAHFVTLCALAIPVLWHKIEKVQYAVLRLTSFLDPGAAPSQVSYQLKQSLIAVGSGGLFGVGFGQGRQQYGFLPFPYSDFIASNIGEEWGFLGLGAVTLAFAAYALLGFRIARQARSPFLQLVAVGLTFVTVITAYLHIGVVIGLLPTTGLTLPFVSYGRSNIVLTMFLTGVLVNIGSTKERVIGSGATDPLALPAT